MHTELWGTFSPSTWIFLLIIYITGGFFSLFLVIRKEQARLRTGFFRTLSNEYRLNPVSACIGFFLIVVLSWLYGITILLFDSTKETK